MFVSLNLKNTYVVVLHETCSEQIHRYVQAAKLVGYSGEFKPAFNYLSLCCRQQIEELNLIEAMCTGIDLESVFHVGNFLVMLDNLLLVLQNGFAKTICLRLIPDHLHHTKHLN